MGKRVRKDVGGAISSAGQVPSPTMKDPNAGGGSYGTLPMMDNGLTFTEVGSYGLRAFSGYVREEFLTELVGRQGAQKFREMLDNNATVGAVMFSIISTMRKVEWRLTPANDSPEAQESCDFVDSCKNDMSHTWEDFIVEVLSMLGYGYAFHELVYKRRLGRDPGKDPKTGEELPRSDYDDGYIGWRRLPIRGQDTILKWFFDANGQIKGVTQQPYVGPLIDIPIEKALLFRPQQHKNNPEGRSVLRTGYVSYYYIKRLQEQEAILGERMGGLPLIKVPSSVFQNAAAGDPQAVALMNMVKKIVTTVRIDEQMGVVLPSDTYPGQTGPSAVPMYHFELVTPQGGRGTALNFDTTIQRYNLNILLSVLCDFLALGHEARGTQSLAVTKVDLFFQAIEGFLNSIAAIINRYAIPRLWRLNGFDPDLMPKLEPDLAQRVDLDVLSNFVLRMAQAGMPLFPDEDLQNYIRDAAGLPEMVDTLAMQAAGVLPEQLDRKDDQAEAALQNTLNPPKPQGPLQKLVLAELAKRVIRMQGPRYGVRTAGPRHVHKRRGIIPVRSMPAQLSMF